MQQLHTIYYRLLLVSCKKIPVLISFNWVWFKPVATGFLQFFAVLVQFFLYFHIRQPVAVAVRSKIAKKLDQTGL